MEIGHPSAAPMNNSDTTILGRPAGIDVDEKAHEIYFADGYLNRRVIVFDSETGAFKRMWGAYGKAPSDADLMPYSYSLAMRQASCSGTRSMRSTFRRMASCMFAIE